MYKKPATRTVVVASGGTTSGAFYIGDHAMVGVQTPSALTSTAITFLASTEKDGTYTAVVDSSDAPVSLAVAASEAIGLSGAELDALAPWTWLKLVCGSTEAAERTFIVALK